jgi:signal transduction histidine kinase
MNAFRHSIRTQLIVVAIVSLLVLAVTLELIALNQQQGVYINSERRVSLTLIRSINNTINSVKPFINTLRDIAELDTRLAELVQLNTNISFIAVTDEHGQVIFHSNRQFQGTAIPEIAQLPFDSTVSKIVPGAGEVYLTSLSFDASGLSEISRYWITVASAAGPIKEQLLNAAVSSALIPALFTVLVAFFFIIFLQTYLVRPLGQLTKAANAIEAGDLSVQVNTTQNNEIGQLTRSFNRMTRQLADLIATLEERVAARTHDLELASDISHRIAANLEDKQLFKELVERTRTAFNLAQVSLFLYNATSGQAEYQEGSGSDTNRTAPIQRAFGPSDVGAIPQAMAGRKTALVNGATKLSTNGENGSASALYSELAIPLMIQEELIGVLDLQSEVMNRFNEGEIKVFTSLAEQLAVAVRNVQLLAQTQHSLEAAEKANAVKSTFLASMSHELRTPLNAIINFNKFVMKGVMGSVNERQTEALQTVDESAQHLLSLINDVLDISKIESGSLVLFVEDDVNLSDLLESAIRTAKGLLSGTNVKLTTEIDAEIPTVRGDKQRLLQILLNVLSNAAKFTEAGEIHIEATHKDAEILVTVKDTGAGIAPEEQNLVFEAFKQTQAGIAQGRGTGLGMPISKRLVEAHGGRMHFESAPGQGTTFYIAMPIKSDKLVPSFT